MSYTTTPRDFSDKDAAYRALARELGALIEGEPDPIANAANAAALLFDALPGINWAGFYFLRGRGLVLGPFQGKPACVRIALGSGACGAAAVRRQTLIVDDVHAFPGNIVCDPASLSEIVLPLVDGARLLGVLDIDSPSTRRFDSADARGLEAFASRLVPAIARLPDSQPE